MNWEWREQDEFYGTARAEDVPVELAVLFLSGQLFCFWQSQDDHTELGQAEVWEC